MVMVPASRFACAGRQRWIFPLSFKTATREHFCSVIASAAKQSIVPQLTKLDCFAALAMTAGDRAASTHWLAMAAQHRSTHLRDLAARMRPSFANNYPRKEGAGNAGCALHPQSRVQKVESTRGRHHRFTGATGIPRAMVLTG